MFPRSSDGWQNSFPRCCSLRPLFSCLVLSMDYSQFLEAAENLCHMLLPQLQFSSQPQYVKSSPCFDSFWYPFSINQGNLFTFKGFTWLCQVHWDNLLLIWDLNYIYKRINELIRYILRITPTSMNKKRILTILYHIQNVQYLTIEDFLHWSLGKI